MVLGHRNEARRSQVCNLNVTDMRGNRHFIHALGVDEITQVEKAPKVRSLVATFPGAGQNQARAFNRPYGTIHLLLVMASCSLHSKDRSKEEDLRLNKAVFHQGLMLTGKIPNQSISGSSIHAHVNSAVLVMQAVTTAPYDSVQNSLQSVGAQHKCSRSASRRWNKRHREQH